MQGSEILGVIGGFFIVASMFAIMFGPGESQAAPALIIGGVGLLFFIIGAALSV